MLHEQAQRPRSEKAHAMRLLDAPVEHGQRDEIRLNAVMLVGEHLPGSATGLDNDAGKIRGWRLGYISQSPPRAGDDEGRAHQIRGRHG